MTAGRASGASLRTISWVVLVACQWTTAAYPATREISRFLLQLRKCLLITLVRFSSSLIACLLLVMERMLRGHITWWKAFLKSALRACTACHSEYALPMSLRDLSSHFSVLYYIFVLAPGCFHVSCTGSNRCQLLTDGPAGHEQADSDRPANLKQAGMNPSRMFCQTSVLFVSLVVQVMIFL